MRLAEGLHGRRLLFWHTWRFGDRLRPTAWEMAVQLRFEPRDLWLGLFFDGDRGTPVCVCPDANLMACYDFYFVLVPTLVLHVYLRKEYPAPASLRPVGADQHTLGAE